MQTEYKDYCEQFRMQPAFLPANFCSSVKGDYRSINIYIHSKAKGKNKTQKREKKIKKKKKKERKKKNEETMTQEKKLS